MAIVVPLVTVSKPLPIDQLSKVLTKFIEAPQIVTATVTACLFIFVWLMLKAQAIRSIILSILTHLSGHCEATISDQERTIRQLVNRSEQELEKLRRTHRDELNSLKQRESDLSLQVEQLLRDHEISAANYQSFNANYQSAFANRIWLAQNPTSIPPFFSLETIKTPIISFFNLKGGVGKTTLCAHLAATYWARGEKILLIDLDYQASLTTFCVSAERIHELDYFIRKPSILRCAAPALANATRYGNTITMDRPTHPIDELIMPVGQGGSCIVPTFDRLADDEVELMVKWLFGQNSDPRFHLRALLHCEELLARFDRILIDCPPRLTTASVNSLACSHFTLVPAIPDMLSLDAVPRLFRHLDKLMNTGVCPQMKILGIVPNKALNANGLSNSQQRQWDLLRDRLTPDAYMMQSFIPDRSNLRPDGAFHTVPPNLQPFFNDLAHEIDTRINEYARI